MEAETKLPVQHVFVAKGYLVVGPNCWGRGETIKAALKACRANGPKGKLRFNVIAATCDCTAIEVYTDVSCHYTLPADATAMSFWLEA